tara:strand:+ start:47 stop:616 length:570 start_codon:yes stop_codon:yes gene_type:complete
MWLALSIWGTFVEFMQNRGKRKSSKKSGKKKKKKKQSKKKSDNKDAEQDGDGKAKIENSNGVEGTQPKKEEERQIEKEAVEDEEGSSSDDEEGDSSSDEVDEEDEEEEENLPNVGPSFVGASVLSDIYGGQRRRPSAKGRTSAGLRASEPRTVGGRRIQTPIVMPHRADITNIKTTGDDDTPTTSKEED